MKRGISRRQAVSRVALGTAGLLLGCSLEGTVGTREPGTGRLLARPRAGVGNASPGTSPLLLQSGRDGVIYVPPGLTPGPVPLILMLHGAGGSARPLLQAMQSIADDTGCCMLLPDSRGVTWDVIRGEYGEDVRFIDAALSAAFGKFAVDPDRLAVAGFSDGASYALALGLINGDVFREVIAFSPGFLPPGEPVGHPSFFITHGTHDEVLPLELTSEPIVETLTSGGFPVTFRSWDGGHAIPGTLAREAFAAVAAGPM